MKAFLPLLVVAAIAITPTVMAGKKGGNNGGGNKIGGGGNKGGAGVAHVGGNGGNAMSHQGLGHQGLGHQNAMNHQGLGHQNALSHQNNMSGLGKHNQITSGAWRHQNQLKSLVGKNGPAQLNLHHQMLHTARLNVNKNVNGAFNRTFHVQKYSVVVKNYHVVYHERFWWQTHYSRIVLVGGGWYYWDAGYWYPAWGYDPGVAVYAYEGPIYSYDNLPPDQVILSVQSELEFQGYYSGPIDGQLGPLTRAAIADYQRDNDLEITSAVDEPTVFALGLV